MSIARSDDHATIERSAENPSVDARPIVLTLIVVASMFVAVYLGVESAMSNRSVQTMADRLRGDRP